MGAPEQSSAPLGSGEPLEALRQAQSLYGAGHWGGAEVLCRQMLEFQGDHYDALLLLGIILAQTRRLTAAAGLLDRAIVARPDNAAAHFNHGNVLTDLGRFEAALASYREAERLKPDVPEHHYACGNTLRTLVRFEEALASYEQALKLRPGYAEAYLNRGATLQELGRPEEALASCERALQLRPDYADAHYNRGIALHSLRRFYEAVDSYDRVLRLDPVHVQVLINRGATLFEVQQYEEALASYDRALALQPDRADAWMNRSIALNRLQHFEQALASSEQALLLKPEYAEAYISRGVVLEGQERLEEALASYDRALALQPERAEVWMNRSVVLQRLRRFEQALASCEQALLLKPEYPEAYISRGVVLECQERVEEALASCERALEIRPDYALAHVNRSGLLYFRLDPEGAIASCDRAIALQPDFAPAYVGRSFALLMQGDFERGWTDFEWRWKHEGTALYKTKLSLEQPLWLGQVPLAGKTILLHAEQGLGDTLQFCRYASQVAEQGARVILLAPPQLCSLLSSLEGVVQVVVSGESVPPFDYHCPLMSLPLAVGTTLASVPAQVPYLIADPEKVRAWRQRLGEPRGLRVGLVWSGGFRPDKPELWALHNRRNIPLQKLAPLRQAGIEFYSLQKGQPAESELATLVARGWEGPQLLDLTGQLKDFGDTAALIENLDLTISVDTSTAHLAGALGRPVWLLSRYDSCWRWMLEREDTPWYPTMRLYRQEQPGGWDTVIERVTADLAALRTNFPAGPNLP